MRRTPVPRRATLEDVARIAGVGAMTVSRTINSHPYVSEKTAKKVRAAILQLGYRPNHAARMLTGQLSRSIGLIVPDLADPFFSVVSHAVQETARENGYLVWLAASNDDPAIEAAQVEQMMHHPVDGILLVPVDGKHKYLKSVAESATPLVTIDRPIEVAASDSVEVENRAGARMAVEHLLRHGYKRIVCVGTNMHLLTLKERLIGYEECMRKAKLPHPRTIRSTCRDDVKAAFKEIFESRTPPDALFSANNASTIWAIEALRELKIEIGRDVALVGFDDVEFYSLLSPPITTIRQPAPELGHMAARLLLQRIRGEFTASSVRTVLPVSLVVRESCGCKRKE